MNTQTTETCEVEELRAIIRKLNQDLARATAQVEILTRALGRTRDALRERPGSAS